MTGVIGPGVVGPGVVGPGVLGTGVVGGGGVPPPANDPFFAQVQALLHFDGVNGATVYPDVKGHTFANTAAGPSLETAVVKFGTASFQQPDTSSILLSDFYSAFTPVNQEYTVEMWVYFKPPLVVVSNVRTFASMQYNAGGGQAFQLNFDTVSGRLSVGVAGGASIFGVTPIVLSTWYHVALTRNAANAITLWLNGAIEGTSSGTTVLNGTSRFILGNSAQALRGNLDDFRWTPGVCRYTAPFSPPTAAFPDS